MKIVNSEIKIPKVASPTSEYFESYLSFLKIDFVRWAIVGFDEDSFLLNVSHKIDIIR